MAAHTDVIEALREWLEPEGPRPTGEWYMRCPLHDDQRRSASLNIDPDSEQYLMWYCQKCRLGGPVDQLLKDLKKKGAAKESKSRKKSSLPSGRQIAEWQESLLNDEVAYNRLSARKGLSQETIEAFEIGFDTGRGVYTIPIYDEEGHLVNVRFYQFDAPDERNKIWSVPGFGSPTLFPMDSLDNDMIVLCEGEWDAMLTIQNGVAAITRTGGASHWNGRWNERFRGKTVFICQDMDTAGQAANTMIANQLRGVAKEIRIVELPYEVTDKGGKDLSDFWLDGHGREEFLQLLVDSPSIQDFLELLVEQEPTRVSVLDSFASEHYGKKLEMRVTITGRTQRPYLIPKRARLRCDMLAGPKCDVCPMKEQYKGDAEVEIKKYDPIVLGMVGSSEKERTDLLKQTVKPQKCTRVESEVTDQYAVEELFVRPAIDRGNGTSSEDYANRKIISVGNHDDMPNTTVRLVGAIFPNPRSSHNEFLAWEVVRTETDLDSFSVSKDTVSRLERFATTGDPLEKVEEISTDLQDNVTGIIGRPLLHQMMDLTIHSVLEFPFGDDIVSRGWLECLIVGDTRTGKSEAAVKILDHYGVGEVISCEGASFAGVVGGLEQVAGKDWIVKWGAVPLNDRRTVVLDEVTGLSQEQIAQMSSIRSSGEAQLTKIQSERTLARTRLIWLANPRGGGQMADFTYGVMSLVPLIGTQEDVARFDIAMTLDRSDVSTVAINSPHRQAVKHIYTSALCHELVQWVWTRTADDVIWNRGAEELVHKKAIELSQRFTEQPPLIQGANVRIKLARLACAFAARTFSTNRAGKKLLITKAHVEAAARWLLRVYGEGGFGYLIYSEMQQEDIDYMLGRSEEIKGIVLSWPGLARFMGSTIQFTRADIEGLLGLAPGDANGLINRLYQSRVIIPEGRGLYKIQPAFKTGLREWIQEDKPGV